MLNGICFLSSTTPSPLLLRPLAWPSCLTSLVRRELRLASFLASVESALEAEGSLDPLDPVSRVDVLDERDLVASRAALAGDDGARSKEILPDLEANSQQTIQKSHTGYSILTLYQRLPYLAITLSLLPIQFLYHLQSVAE